MKKVLCLFLISVAFALGIKAQCPITACQDSLAAGTSTWTLNVASGIGTSTWSVLSGPGTVNNGVVSGLQTGATTVLLLQSVLGNTTTFSYKVITVAPKPLVPRTVTGVSFTITGGIKFTFSDGGTQ